MFTIIKGIEQGGKAAKIEQERCPPENMTDKPVHFHSDDPNILGTLGYLDSHGTLDRKAIAMIIGQCVEIIHASGIGHELGKGTVFGHLFMHTMNIAENRLCLDNIFTIQRHLYPENTMGCWMLRTYVENKGLVMSALDRYGHGLKSFKSGWKSASSGRRMGIRLGCPLNVIP